MGVLFGLLAALGWGAGDFVLSRISRSLGAAWTMLYVQVAGIIAGAIILLARRDLPPLDPAIWMLAVGVNLFNLLGTVMLYRALAVGTVAIVSPIAASFAAVTAILTIAAGERPTPLALAGVALVMAGVIVVSRAPAVPGATVAPARGVLEASGAALCYGCFFWLIRPVTVGLGVAWPVMVGRVMAAGAALLFLLARREGLRSPNRRLWGAVIVETMLDTLAFLSYNLGILTAYVSVVTALASIFSAVTVLLAWVFLRERLVVSQWAGVAAVLVGVLLVSV